MIALRVALQYGLGVILLTTGLGKFLDLQGFIAIMETYRLTPMQLNPPLAVLLVLCELKIAESLLRGRRLRAAAVASTVLHACFTAVALTTLVRGIKVDNCGCFGVFFARPLTWVTFAEDFALLSASAVLVGILTKSAIRAGSESN